MLVAVVLGPILAVQAQKWIERARERKNRKQWIFNTLMATRAARVAPEHVTALNMIDLAFYGRRAFSVNYKTRKERLIVEAWKEYFDHLHNVPEGDLTNWTARGDELFVNLLHAISRDVNFDFDRVSLKRGIYSPRAHGDQEFDQLLIRKLMVKLLTGEQPLKMAVMSLPGMQQPPAATGSQTNVETDTLPKALPDSSTAKAEKPIVTTDRESTQKD